MSDAEMQRDGTLMIGGGGKSEINGKPVPKVMDWCLTPASALNFGRSNNSETVLLNLSVNL